MTSCSSPISLFPLFHGYVNEYLLVWVTFGVKQLGLLRYILYCVFYNLKVVIMPICTTMRSCVICISLLYCIFYVPLINVRSLLSLALQGSFHHFTTCAKSHPDLQEVSYSACFTDGFCLSADIMSTFKLEPFKSEIIASPISSLQTM